MSRPSDLDVAIAKRSGRVAIIIVALFVGWGALQFFGLQLNLSRRTMGLGDAVALVGMGWAIYETWGIWRMRREKE